MNLLQHPHSKNVLRIRSPLSVVGVPSIALNSKRWISATSPTLNSVGRKAKITLEHHSTLGSIDYTNNIPSIRKSPPPPPPRKGRISRFVYPIILITFSGTFVYFYINNKNDNYAYWDAMQSGEGILEEDDDDYDDDEDDDDEEEEFEKR